MPKYTVYKICPFYIDENKKTISCEDVCRSFRSSKAKWKWMNKYCDTWEWESCQWAKQISEAYRKYEEGDIMALDEHKLEALTKETKYLRTRLGKAEKRVERQQKKIDELRAVNQSFVTSNNNLEKQKQELYKKWRDTNQSLQDHLNKAGDELSAMAQIYEQRMCYLIDRFAPDGVKEDEIEAWAADKEFALVADFTEDGKAIAWKVAFREEETNEDTKKQEQVQE